ncbi:MAG: haloacid dehalogenase type II [Gammaproteobacteria bacterium]|nr:haloacid dehalogenase type II [Gammaproteobacteria bacterium]
MSTNPTLGFDVYGTLIDTHGVIVELEKHIGDLAPCFSQVWREKQLEYTFRRGLMERYQPFGICTRDALNYTNQILDCGLNEQQKSILLQCYATLPAFDDAIAGLEQAMATDFNLFAFSNGQESAVDQVLKNAGIRHYFKGIVSVDDLKTFKPNPSVYQYFIKKTNSDKSSAWLVSSNGFDVIGAVSIGMQAAWVHRSKSVVYDPWGVHPTLTVNSLDGLSGSLRGH